MTDYVKSTNFTSKDSLATGNPLKIIKGAEFDTEFNALATAVATKANINSPSFTGVPLAPTASVGTSTTQLATTAFATEALQALYPVGSVYINASVSTSPATLFGFGTWSVFGAGKVLVSQDTTDASFDVLSETGGSKDSIVPSHTHTASTNTVDLSHTHQWYDTISGGSAAGFSSADSNNLGSAQTGPMSANATHSHTVTVASTGVSATNTNLQPYIVVKMWVRTA